MSITEVDTQAGPDTADPADTADPEDPDDPADTEDTGGTGDVTQPQRFRPGQCLSRLSRVQPEDGFSFGFDPRRLMPSVVLYLHLYARTDTGEIGPVARWEGRGAGQHRLCA